jgi:hypothetical protein
MIWGLWAHFTQACRFFCDLKSMEIWSQFTVSGTIVDKLMHICSLFDILSFTLGKNVFVNSPLRRPILIATLVHLLFFVFSLLRIKGLYMFRALLAHLQEALRKRHLAYCVRVLHQDWSGTCSTPILVQPTANSHNTDAIHEVPFVLMSSAFFYGGTQGYAYP